MLSLLTDIASRFHLARKAGKWTGPCPKCGGSTDSDKFNIRDDGGFKCYACEFKGDIITWLREMEGKSCPEAHETAAMECRTWTSCPAAGNCRLGHGNNHTGKPARRAKTVIPPPSPRAKALPSAQERQPENLWSAWAEDLAAKAAIEIHKQQAVLTWLANRGIDAAAVARFGLGWLNKNEKIIRQDIGLPPRDDGKATLWIPAGLVIRIPNESGAIHRLRIRRPSWARENFLPRLKYVWIEGSGTSPLVIRPAGQSRGTVVVEADLCAYAVAAAHREVTVISLGSVSAGIPEPLKDELAEEPVILLALDADPDKDGKTGPGPAAIAAWKQEFRQAKFWPVPEGKDPGDYVKKHQGNLNTWVEAGLIPRHQTPPPAGHDEMSIPGRQTSGGGGGDDPSIPETSTSPAARIFELADGREIHLVEEKPTWDALTADGKLAFSTNEMQRLHTALAGCDADERRNMINTVLDIKELFTGAYIRAGRMEA